MAFIKAGKKKKFMKKIFLSLCSKMDRDFYGVSFGFKQKKDMYLRHFRKNVLEEGCKW
jgi:hypothetical protein